MTTTESKRIVRRNLPINDIYNLIDSYYTGAILDGGGTCCENCNKIITNVAVLQNKEGNKYNVGLDCAETLRNLDYFDFNKVKADFNEAKAIRAKVNKAIKEGKQVEFLINYYGNLNISCSGKFSETKPIDYAQKFLPDYLKKVSNPEKIGFTYNVLELDTTNLRSRKNANGLLNEIISVTINENTYALNVRITEKPFFSKSENKECINYRNEYDLILNNEVKETKEAFVLSDLEFRFNTFIAKNEHRLF